MSITGQFIINKGSFSLNTQFSIPEIGVTGIFGPSGSGKTTLLKAIAGLETAPNNQLTLGKKILQNSNHCLPAHQRPIGFVFQDARLFEHLSVRGNLKYAQKRSTSKVPGQTTRNLKKMIDLLDIGSILDRSVSGLSGGEKQKVAIARALVRSPDLLLMDEPLASLDPKGRNAILPLLKQLQNTLTIPILYVSHSLHEIQMVADHLLLMNNGKITASGPPQKILNSCLKEFVERDDHTKAVTQSGTIETWSEEIDHITFQIKVSKKNFSPPTHLKERMVSIQID